jgi:hypothetical protein
VIFKVRQLIPCCNRQNVIIMIIITVYRNVRLKDFRGDFGACLLVKFEWEKNRAKLKPETRVRLAF